MLPAVLIGVAVVVLALVALVASRPAAFRISRTVRISAPAQSVFALVNDFHQWERWSPYEKRDMAMTKAYEGAASGAGAAYGWSGDKQVGQGRMTIVESRPCELICIRLEFERPFKATNTAEFAFAAEGSQTAVTWSLLGRNNFMMKAMSLLLNMDQMIGKDFEQGLSQLKAEAEGQPR